MKALVIFAGFPRGRAGFPRDFPAGFPQGTKVDKLVKCISSSLKSTEKGTWGLVPELSKL